MRTRVWVAVDVGCIECGEETRVLGVYPTEAMARRAVTAEANRLGVSDVTETKFFVPKGNGRFKGGERAFEVLNADYEAGGTRPVVERAEEAEADG